MFFAEKLLSLLPWYLNIFFSVIVPNFWLLLIVNTFSRVQSFNQFSNFQNVTHILEELIVRSSAIFKNVDRILNQSPTHNVTWSLI